MNIARKALLGLLCGLVVGAVILGVGGRAVMSAIAQMRGALPTWSLGGTLDVVAFGAIVGAAAGLSYNIVGAYLPGPRSIRGLLAGLLLFGVMALIRPPSARSAMTGFDDLLLPIALLFGVLCMVFGGVLAVTMDVSSKRWVAKNP